MGAIPSRVHLEPGPSADVTPIPCESEILSATPVARPPNFYGSRDHLRRMRWIRTFGAPKIKCQIPLIISRSSPATKSLQVSRGISLPKTDASTTRRMTIATKKFGNESMRIKANQSCGYDGLAWILFTFIKSQNSTDVLLENPTEPAFPQIGTTPVRMFFKRVPKDILP